jgi:hypothetical protein
MSIDPDNINVEAFQEWANRPEPETIALTPYPRLKVSMLSPNFPDIYTERHQR